MFIADPGYGFFPIRIPRGQKSTESRIPDPQHSTEQKQKEEKAL
jgi:hypothetical protein